LKKTTNLKEIFFLSKVKDCISRTFQAFTDKIFKCQKRDIFSSILTETLEIPKYLSQIYGLEIFKDTFVFIKSVM